MGLGFCIRRYERVDNCSWSYSGFRDFRDRLAQEIGINLREMPGFTKKETSKVWPFSEQEPLVLLLNYSDCDGGLGAKDCEVVWPRLQEIVTRWPDDDYDRCTALRLIEAMREVADHDLYLEFA